MACPMRIRVRQAYGPRLGSVCPGPYVHHSNTRLVRRVFLRLIVARCGSFHGHPWAPDSTESYDPCFLSVPDGGSVQAARPPGDGGALARL